MTGKGIILFFVFLEEGDPRALPAAMIFLYVRGVGKVVLMMNWTSFFGPQSNMDSCHPILFLHPTAGCGDVCANGGDPWGYSTRHSAGTMGRGPFHCIAPFLTSLMHTAAVFMAIHILATSLSVVLPAQPTTTRIDRVQWLNRTTSIEWVCVCLCVCALVYMLPTDTEGHWNSQHRFRAGLMYVFTS